jgi:transposase
MKAPSYEGKQVYIGLDVHRECFVASCISEGAVVKRCPMPGTAEAVVSLVTRAFAGANILAAYEAGYSGFWLYRKLEAAGIRCLVVHPASIEVSSRDTVKKSRQNLSSPRNASRLFFRKRGKTVRSGYTDRRFLNFL